MKSFAESFSGKLLLGVTLASTSSAIGVLVGWATSIDAPPEAIIRPATIDAQLLQVVQISAAESSDKKNGTLLYTWRLNGLQFGLSSAGQCIMGTRYEEVSCRFSFPGTHTVAVEVVDGNGLSASAVATVNVSAEDGYLGLIVANSKNRARIEEFLLVSIDWVAIQSYVTSPIVIYDPSRKEAIYAVAARRDLQLAAEIANHQEFPDSFRLFTFGIPDAAMLEITKNAKELAVNIEYVVVSRDSSANTVPENDPDIGTFLLSNPQELVNRRASF